MACDPIIPQARNPFFVPQRCIPPLIFVPQRVKISQKPDAGSTEFSVVVFKRKKLCALQLEYEKFSCHVRGRNRQPHSARDVFNARFPRRHEVIAEPVSSSLENRFYTPSAREFTMNSNILSLPFRRTTSLAPSAAIKQYISSKYDQHPDMFETDLVVIDNLRRDAVNVREPHFSGIKKIVAYAGQLSWIGGKFPIDIGADFMWYPALGYNTERPVTLNNLKFELANILYNLAALYSQLAISSNRSTAAGLRSACNYFCLSAGVVLFLKDSVISAMRSDPPEDMDESTLECLQQLMLAQAQECFWQKAVIDGYKDASIARLAAKVSDLYAAAGDWGVKSDAISSEWIHHTAAKHHHFAAAAQYRQACDCLEKRRYGEEVARLRDSLAHVQEGLKEAKYLNKSVLGDLNSLKKKVSEDLRRAEKDNDLIYLSPVPPKPELKKLERANMAATKIPKELSEPSAFIGEDKEFGPPLFAKLVPFAIHVAASIYEERRDRLINTTIISFLEELNTKIHSTLSSLSLPGSLQALEKPLGIPLTLTSHAEEIRQSDAVARLERSFSDTSKLAQSASSIFSDARSLLMVESAENERLKAKYGTDRWTRLDSPLAAAKLYAQVDEIDGYLKSAANSDHLVLTKFQGCEDMLRILSGTDREIGNFVPNARRVALNPQMEEQVSRLRNSLDELTRLESRRRKKMESVREKAKRDNINQEILAETARLERADPAQTIEPAHFEDFFETRLAKYDVDIEALKMEEDEQEALLRQLHICNEGFVAARKGNEGDREREKALQGLENAYFRYKEIVSNLEAGRKFYNDLGRIVGGFAEGVKTWVVGRREEAMRLESDLSLPPLSTLSLRQTDSQQPSPISPQTRLYRGPQSSPPLPSQFSSQQAPSAPQSPLTQKQTFAPIPQKRITGPVTATWDPEIGIKFGGGGGDIAGGQESRRGSNTSGISGVSGVRNGSVTGVNSVIGVGSNQSWDPQRGVRFG